MNERIKELAEQAHSYACKYAQQPDYNPHNPYNQGMYKQRYDSKFAELVRADEREACAKVCDDIDDSHWGCEVKASWCSREIRARGETK
jgi:hypothetical protein